jgi:hypothetical protein
VIKRYPRINKEIIAPIIYPEEVLNSTVLVVANKIVVIIVDHFLMIQKCNGIYNGFVRIIP